MDVMITITQDIQKNNQFSLGTTERMSNNKFQNKFYSMYPKDSEKLKDQRFPI